MSVNSLRRAALAAALGCLGAWPARAEQAEEPPFDPSQYPARSLSGLLAANPCAYSSGYEVKDILFSIGGVYQASLRETSKARRELVRRWAEKLNAADQARFFDKEVRLGDGKSAWWVQVSSKLVPDLRRDLKAGDQATFYMTFAGCAAGESVLVLEEFIPPVYDDLEEEASSYVT